MSTTRRRSLRQTLAAAPHMSDDEVEIIDFVQGAGDCASISDGSAAEECLSDASPQPATVTAAAPCSPGTAAPAGQGFPKRPRLSSTAGICCGFDTVAAAAVAEHNNEADGEVNAGHNSEADGGVDAGHNSEADGEVDAGHNSEADGEVDAGHNSEADGEVDAGHNSEADGGVYVAPAVQEYPAYRPAPRRPRSKPTKGSCHSCDKSLTFNNASKHAAQCWPAGEGGAASVLAIKSRSCGRELRDRATHRKSPLYWMVVAVPHGCTLLDVDKLLRRTWLECCGHLSQFFEAPKCTPVQALPVGHKLSYCYDPRGGSYIDIQKLGTVHCCQSVTEPSVMVRSARPMVRCCLCDASRRAVVCAACQHTACEPCSQQHACPHCDRHQWLPMGDSPRSGMCKMSASAMAPVWPGREFDDAAAHDAYDGPPLHVHVGADDRGEAQVQAAVQRPGAAGGAAQGHPVSESFGELKARAMQIALASEAEARKGGICAGMMAMNALIVRMALEAADESGIQDGFRIDA